jgi:hypothetical protein
VGYVTEGVGDSGEDRRCITAEAGASAKDIAKDFRGNMGNAGGMQF